MIESVEAKGYSKMSKSEIIAVLIGFCLVAFVAYRLLWLVSFTTVTAGLGRLPLPKRLRTWLGDHKHKTA